ncbi:class I SAM-dependent methyltransferase [Roseospira visakhapatnamensis]|uniref:SAM-dependent methyltransferase n=1 Tax=Roseospira visakhapatnamensis TaxID=390880 RepID=A0A7W6REY9_9PROT|nr:class I SAM-dependent methyltransferase [Roseospira visakhapatnamensis]MBB4267072.1 SAM-dependent methyltransferase [Roseospira visakhapatnamensis]
MQDVTPIVAKQYTQYSYPEPIADMKRAIREGFHERFSPNLLWPMMWPSGKSFKQLKILVAGCGTNQAAYTAAIMPDAHVLGIDLSITSLQHSQFLKEKHGLDNLSLRQMNLLNLCCLEDKYDYIVCTGVLHHLSNPDAGLRALKGVLASDGVMYIMVYGRYNRIGVYMLQRAFRLLRCESQSSEDLMLVKSTLDFVDPDHAVKRYLKVASDVNYDAGLIDTFLHPQDRAYDVPEVLAFSENNALGFIDWTDRLPYTFSAAIPPQHPLARRLKNLSIAEKWTVMELLFQNRGTHAFLLGHPEYVRSMPRVDFRQGDQWRKWYPSVRAGFHLVEKANSAKGTKAKYLREGHTVIIEPDYEPIIESISGRRSCDEVIKRAQSKSPHLSDEQARLFFGQLHEWHHLLFSEVPYGSC